MVCIVDGNRSRCCRLSPCSECVFAEEHKTMCVHARKLDKKETFDGEVKWAVVQSVAPCVGGCCLDRRGTRLLHSKV